MRSLWVAIGGLVVLFVAIIAASPTRSASLPPPDPASQLIPCSQSASRVQVDTSSHLEGECTYTGGFDIVKSGVTLDCQGARVEGSGSGRGIHIKTSAEVPLSDVTVRNCDVRGFLNNVRISREGFRDLLPGLEYVSPTERIVIEDSTFADSRGSGLFVDAYVTGVTLRRLHISGSGSVGIYLEAGSRDNVIEDSVIEDNGYGENGPGGQIMTISGVDFIWFGTGREGIAVDGSRHNVIRRNVIRGNSAGGLFLYKNCGEFVNERPSQWWERRYGSEGNLIEQNEITDEPTGVWVGSRMGENQYFMDCSDPAYLEAPLLRYHLDRAAGNTIRSNTFARVTYGVRVEDDGTLVEGNRFEGGGDSSLAVIVGTDQRTSELGLPVERVRIEENSATIGGMDHPYRWVHRVAELSAGQNQSNGRDVGVCEGVPLPYNPFLFVTQFAPYDPDEPASTTTTTAPSQPACAEATTGGSSPPPPASDPATPVPSAPAFTG